MPRKTKVDPAQIPHVHDLGKSEIDELRRFLYHHDKMTEGMRDPPPIRLVSTPDKLSLEAGALFGRSIMISLRADLKS